MALETDRVFFVRTGQMQPESSCFKVLECAVPGSPLSSAPGLNASFRDYIAANAGGAPLSIAVNLDCPDEAIVRAIVEQNWWPPP